MKYKPQNLTSRSSRLVLAIVAAAVVFGPMNPVLVLAQEEPVSDTATEKADAQPATTSSKLSAAEVFAGVEAKLNGAKSLSCKLQQTIMMSHQRFVAAGSYTHASGNRMRLEYRIFPVRSVKAADKAHFPVDSDAEDTSVLESTGSLLQVSDGSVLRAYWVNGEEKKLTRRNLQQIMDAVGDAPSEISAKQLQNLGVGGLQALMSQIQTGMEFGVVQEQQLSDTKLLVLSGRWNQETREEVFKLTDESKSQLPEYVPDYVRVYVDAEGMLPRRIQYLKKHPNPESKQVRPLLTLDFRSIQIDGELPPDAFTFAPPAGEDLKEVDVTAEIIAGVTQLAKAAQSKSELPLDGDADKAAENK